MTRETLIARLHQLIAETCDEDLEALLELAIIALEGKVCLTCGKEGPELKGYCRPCYVRARRARTVTCLAKSGREEK